MRRKNNCGLSHNFFAWGTITVFTVGFFIATMQSVHAYETRRDKMNLAFKSQINSPEIPPIDESEPSIIETVSFGLG